MFRLPISLINREFVLVEIYNEHILLRTFNDELPNEVTVSVRSIGHGLAWDTFGR